MMKETVDTFKNQKKINYAINGSYSREEFIKKLTDNLPEPPAYFPFNVKLNQQGYEDLSEIIKKSKNPLSVSEFELMAKEKEIKVIDVRHQDSFAKGHIPNSIFIGLDGGFAPWVGAVLSDINQALLLVVDEDRVDEAITRLSRVGFDNVKGYLKGGFSSWKDSGKEIGVVDTISADDFQKTYDGKKNNVFDVRKLTEYQSEHIINAKNIPLNDINDFISDFDVSGENFIHCAGGYRSMIANSILKSHGIHNLVDILGGYSQIKKTDISRSDYVCPSTL